LAVPVRYAASAYAAGSIWLFGGETNNAMHRTIQQVDPTGGRAQVVAELPVAVGHAVAIPVGGRILIAGGRTGPDTVTDRMWWFDPTSRTVRSAGHLPQALADSAVAHWGDDWYLIGGETPSLTGVILRISYR
jgi:N-acetylneuraminic acid mutarotase